MSSFFFKTSMYFYDINVMIDSIAFEKEETCTGRQKITTLKYKAVWSQMRDYTTIRISDTGLHPSEKKESPLP
jgi:hypothetical protein